MSSKLFLSATGSNYIIVEPVFVNVFKEPQESIPPALVEGL